jgi:hypothetical protein
MTGNFAIPSAGYIISDVERLRQPMQLISNHLLKFIEIKELQLVGRIPI